jgi:hypothetical protein
MRTKLMMLICCFHTLSRPCHLQAITRLELQLAGLALAQGKALVVGLNKADAVPGGPAAAEALREQVRTSTPEDVCCSMAVQGHLRCLWGATRQMTCRGGQQQQRHCESGVSPGCTIVGNICKRAACGLP